MHSGGQDKSEPMEAEMHKKMRFPLSFFVNLY